jgi:hypothetical protein
MLELPHKFNALHLVTVLIASARKADNSPPSTKLLLSVQRRIRERRSGQGFRAVWAAHIYFVHYPSVVEAGAHVA